MIHRTSEVTAPSAGSPRHPLRIYIRSLDASAGLQNHRLVVYMLSLISLLFLLRDIAARCTEAFLADLVRESVDRARAAGHREPGKKVRKRPATATSAPQQVLPEDV